MTMLVGRYFFSKEVRFFDGPRFILAILETDESHS